MGATNNTTYYNLSQFVGTDKPAWLQDYNGDMGKIDAGIHQAKAAADAAQGDATQALTNSGLNTTAIGGLQTDVSLLRTATGNNAGAINTINSLIGNGTPTTTDQTLIGGINELNSGKEKAYSTLVVTTDGVKTYGELLASIRDFLRSNPNLRLDAKIVISDGSHPNVYHYMIHPSGSHHFSFLNVTSDTFQCLTLRISDSSAYYALGITSGTFSINDNSSVVPASGTTITLYY